jgi:membrane-associated protease RseP (regulator of RpoE activity)
LSLLSELSGERIDGCLGLDVLRQFVVTLDCDRGVIALRTSLPADAGEAIPLSFDQSGRPVVPVALAGKRATPFAICTGSLASMLLRPPLFAELRDRDFIRSSNPTIGVTELGDLCATGIADEIALGSFVHQNVAVEAFAFDGLGMEFLARYVVTLDFPQRKAYFKPGSAFDRADRLDASGVHFVRREGVVVIDGVKANSPACESGIVVGDVVHRINDQPVSKFSLFRLRHLLQKEGNLVKVAVTRDAEQFEFQFAMRRYQDVVAEAKRRIAQSGPSDGRPGKATVIAQFDVGRRGEPVVVPVKFEGFPVKYVGRYWLGLDDIR